MQEYDLDTLMFFDGHQEALSLYEAFEYLLYDTFSNVNKRVQKTQITFFNRHVFACVSFARVKWKADLPEGYIVLTLGLPEPLDSPVLPLRQSLIPADGHIIL